MVLVPLYLTITGFGLANSLGGIIITGLWSTFGIFMLRQFMETIPFELIDAARIDGASEWRIFAQIVLPLSGAPLAALAVFAFLGNWDSYLWPLVVLGIAMMGFLNKFMDATGVDLEQSTYSEVAATMGAGWSAGKAGGALDARAPSTSPPMADGLRKKISLVPLFPGALKLDGPSVHARLAATHEPTTDRLRSGAGKLTRRMSQAGLELQSLALGQEVPAP